jgi:PD-(D/E)XK nuclease superfamily
MRWDVNMTEWARLSTELESLQAAGRWPSGPTTTLEIIAETRREAVHEKLIAWLLDPLGNHGLGSAVLAALVSCLGTSQAIPPERLAQARIRRQVAGPTGRPDIVAIMPGFTLVIELKIDAEEGLEQTTRQADDYRGKPNVRFVFLTPDGSAPNDPRFRPLSLLDLHRCLNRALASSPPPVLHLHRIGRATAEEYAATLERMFGLDQEAARYWLRHHDEIQKADEAARELLARLPDRTRQVLDKEAARLDLPVRTALFPYTATASWKQTYQETAVLLVRKSWMLDEKEARLGVGLGLAVKPKVDGVHDPFWGIYARDDRVRARVRQNLSRFSDLSDEAGKPWLPWARWWPLDLDPPADQADLLTFYARSVTDQILTFWQKWQGHLDEAIGNEEP